MSHEITSTDHLVLAGKPAWHGLGLVLPNNPDPDQALDAARLGWTVEKKPLFFHDSLVGPVQAGEYCGLIRSDTGTTLGVVTDSYEPLQNKQIAELAWEIGKLSNPDLPVKVESAGSLRGGRDVFFLLKTEDWRIGGTDIVSPYLLMTTAHDGTRSFRIMDTNVRVVCKNTLTSALGSTHGFKIPHKKNIALAAKNAVAALSLAYKGLIRVQTAYAYLAGQPVRTRTDVSNFALQLFIADSGEAPKVRSGDEYQSWIERLAKFTTEFEVAFRTANNTVASTQDTKFQLVNAATYMADHARVHRVKDSKHESVSEAKVFRNMLGSAVPNFKRKALALALKD